jgi:hypothetical protein
MLFLFKDPSWRLFWGRMSFAATSIAPFAFLIFSLFFPKEKWTISNAKLLLISIPSIVLVFLSFTDLVIYSVQWDTLTSNYGPIHPFFGIFVFTNVIGGLFFLLKSYKNSIGLERLQIKYCFLGMFIASMPAVTANFILPYMGTSKLSNLGPPSTIIMVSFITYAILKYNKSSTKDARWNFYRYPEVLLMKAEALSHLYVDDAVQLQNAIDLVNEVRFRGFGIEKDLTLTTTAGMDDVILDERGREFLAEGKRWFELVRFASRDNFAKPELLTDRIGSAYSGTAQTTFLSRIIDPESWYLPLNADALASNPRLVQNPYYE